MGAEDWIDIKCYSALQPRLAGAANTEATGDQSRDVGVTAARGISNGMSVNTQTAM